MIRILVLLCLCSFVAVNSQHDHKVKVDVYYESLCPDSIAFITKQLHPALQKPEINKHVNLTLVPYGKSNRTKDANGILTFSCHHQNIECTGNIIHACALTHIPPDANGQNQVALDFIKCLLADVVNKGEETEFPVNPCGGTAKVQNIADITNCAKHVEGKDLLNMYGEKTDALEKPLTGVPTVVFNGKLNHEESLNAQKDFIKSLCAYIEHDKPTECQSKGGAEALAKPLGITLLMLFVTLKVF